MLNMEELLRMCESAIEHTATSLERLQSITPHEHPGDTECRDAVFRMECLGNMLASCADAATNYLCAEGGLDGALEALQKNAINNARRAALGMFSLACDVFEHAIVQTHIDKSVLRAKQESMLNYAELHSLDLQDCENFLTRIDVRAGQDVVREIRPRERASAKRNTD